MAKSKFIGYGTPTFRHKFTNRFEKHIFQVLLAIIICGLFNHATLAGTIAGITGKDDREIIDPDIRPELNAIGRLNLPGRGFCSAVLIAPDEILTAAHCLWNPKKQKFSEPDRLHFVPGYRRSQYLGHARGLDIRTSATLSFDNDGRPINLIDDWAVIKLDLNLTHGAGIKPIPLAGRQTLLGLKKRTKLTRAGYGRDRPHLPVQVTNCSIQGLLEQRKMIVHDCDATAGDSGSPIMVKRGNGLAVIAVHSAIAKFGGNHYGIAVALARHLPLEGLAE